MHLLLSLKRALFAAFVCFHSKSNSLLSSVVSGEDKELSLIAPPVWTDYVSVYKENPSKPLRC